MSRDTDSTTDAGRIKAKVGEIMKLGVGVDPREFMTALGMVAGTYIAAAWTPDDHDHALDAHCQVLADALAKAAKRIADGKLT